MTYKEKTDPTPTELELLTQNVAALTVVVQSLNVVTMCLLHKLNIETDLPTFQDKENLWTQRN